MLGLTRRPDGSRWLHGQRELGAPYGTRLAYLQLLRISEVQNGIPLEQSFINKKLDWAGFWLAQEQMQTAESMEQAR